MVVTTQQTGKGWKGMQAVGCLGSLIGFAIFIGGVALALSERGGGARPSGIFPGIAIFAILAGLPVYLVGRVGAWWFHA